MYITFLIDVIIELLGPSSVRKTHFVNIFILWHCIAEKAAIEKKNAEEDIARKREVKEAEARKYWAANNAARADVEIVPATERISTVAFLNGSIERFRDDMMKIPPRSPAPEWFCELLCTRKYHLKFIISDPLRQLIGRHSSHMITNYMFVLRGVASEGDPVVRPLPGSTGACCVQQYAGWSVQWKEA